MFFSPSSEPPPAWKRPVYLMATVILGMLLGFIVSIALAFLGLQGNSGPEIRLTKNIGAVLLLIGAVGGFFVGRVWWRWVYIERRWDGKQVGE